MSRKNDLVVSSDVRRDLLASAAAFKTEASAVWEYVVNALQYVERGTQPRIQVVASPRRREIAISDNGRGMDAEDLGHFFRMHGENRDRLRGRIGRGKFGTGKSAAFGIGKSLVVDSRRFGKRNRVVLTREMIDRSRGDEIPLKWEVRDEPTDAPNGTTITIGDIVLPRIVQSTIIEYIERHLQAFRTLGPEVAVGDHICEYREPAVAAVHRFRPPPRLAGLIGDVELVVKVAQAPLPDFDQGIAVTAGVGNLVAVERAGVERKEFGNYLFGEIDVPSLETFNTPLEAYDSSRSLALNPGHPVALAVIQFVGAKLEETRGGLVQKSRDARKTELAKRLDEEADRIADILNQDFSSVQKRLGHIRAAAASSGPAGSAFGDAAAAGAEPDVWVQGSQEPGTLLRAGNGNRGDGKGQPAPAITVSGGLDPQGDNAVDPAGGVAGTRKRPRGGFTVTYSHLGKEQGRSVYDPTKLAILINLDHPVLIAALGSGDVREPDPAFRRLSYEIAFSEYSIALGYEAARHDPDLPPDDLLYEVRSSLNRVALAATALYAGT